MSDAPNDLRRTLTEAADAVRHRRPANGQAAALLHALGYAADDGEESADQLAHRARMLDAAALLTRFFRLAVPDAPGLAVFGGEIDPASIAPWWTGPRVSVSGTGVAPRPAFEACIGEAVEFLSGLQHAGDPVPHTRASIEAAGVDAATATLVRALLGGCGQPEDTPIDWAAARRLSDGTVMLLPADICYRRDPACRTIVPPGPQSVGCAAGATFGAAVLHALLELAERDAAALWWRGGRPGRALPLEHPALGSAAELLRALRQDRTSRRSWLLDITTDLGIPSIAAVSFAEDAHGFCCGTAARTTLEAACHAALREMCQMELAHHVVLAKQRERGDAALNEVDRHHVRRFTEIDAATCRLVQPLPPVGDSVPETGTDDLLVLVDRFVRLGLQPCVIDQTRTELGIPVARVLCPGLEQEPSTLQGERLRAVISDTGGELRYGNGVPLM
ncbi:MAG TPA: YcaO-like family protein [Acetobacteraceae bacterium]